MLASCGNVGKPQGPRFVAFYGCMYYAMMRPSEVAALTKKPATCQTKAGATCPSLTPAPPQAGHSPTTAKSTSTAD